MSPSKRKILFQLSGSIAAFKACALVSKLVQEGFDVQAVCTPATLNFIGPATLEGLTGKPLLSDTFAVGHAMDHIHLAREADLTILCPATASMIGKLAQGIGDDLVSTLFLAHENLSRYWIVPAMNPAMYAHPATRQNLEKLKQWGVRVLEPATGLTACGEEGTGRMLEPEEILADIKTYFTGSIRQKQRVLITSGATREPIDAVRFLTNFSTGATGAAIADAFVQDGNEVVYLHGQGAALPSGACARQDFGSVSDLDEKLSGLLNGNNFDVVIHAAAVSDFTVSRIEDGDIQARTASSDSTKIPSDHEVHLTLSPTAKLVDTIRGRSKNPKTKIVAFKLTHGSEGPAAVRKLLSHSSVDWVVHNHFDDVGPDSHQTTIYNSTAQKVATCSSKTELARALREKLSPTKETTL